MTPETRSFFKPVQVLRLYRKQLRFTKEERRDFDLKAFLAIPDSAASTGSSVEGKLFLPASQKDNSAAPGADLVVMVVDLLVEKSGEFHFLSTSGANAIEIFKIRGKESLELHLDWNYFYVGDPSRQNMKLCDLVPGKAYEIRINGKTDFSLSGRRPRYYLEQVFVVEHLGIFTECSCTAEAEEMSVKTLPQPRKLIDLRKPLW